MIVVKVGGSLFDHPRLGPGLQAYLDSLAPAQVLLVPGGGDFGDAVRKLDHVHGLGEEKAHWLALRALLVAGAFLESVLRLPPTRRPAEPNGDLPLEGGGHTAPDESRFSTSHLEGEVGGPSSDRRVGGERRQTRTPHILDCLAFALEDESRPGVLPHIWDVTTDSIAARAAVVYRAERLVLLKSIDVPPGTPWDTAADRGWVDRHFPTVAAELACPVEVVNFRRVLDALLRS